MKKIFLIMFALVFVASYAFSNGTSESTAPDSKVVLEFWDMDWNAEAGGLYVSSAQALVDKFNETHEDIFVEYQSVAWTDYYQYYLTAVQGGAAPDVFTGGSQTPIQFYAMGEILPVDSIIEEWKKDGQYDDWVEGALESNYYDGHYISIAWQFDSRCIFYNTEMFAEAGIDGESIKTWDDLLAACAKLKEVFPDKVVLAAAGENSQAQQFLNYLLITNNGGQTNADATESTFDSKEMRETLEFLGTLVEKEYLPAGILGYTLADVSRLFLAGDACMMYTGNATIAEDPQMKGKIGMLNALQGPSASKPGVLYWANSAAIFSQTEYPEESKVFLKWWMENCGEIFEKAQLQSLPARKSFSDTEYSHDSWYLSQLSSKLSPYFVHATYPVQGYFPAYGTINGERYLADAAERIYSHDFDYDSIIMQGDESVKNAIALANEY